MINKTIKFSSFFVIFLGLFSKRNRKQFLRVSIEFYYKFTNMVYRESVNLIGSFTVFYLLIDNSCE